MDLRWTREDSNGDVSEVSLMSPNVSSVVTQFLGSFCAKTCFADKFSAYLKARLRVDTRLREFYESGFLRNRKLTAYWKKKSSQDRLVHRISKTFASACGDGDASSPAHLHILWGNWGRKPNALKGSSSTPGIGLRRYVHKRLSRGLQVVVSSEDVAKLVTKKLPDGCLEAPIQCLKVGPPAFATCVEIVGATRLVVY